jgi:hypothetical protein
VAGFDVFGNLSHQVNVRRYMDLLRVEGDLNFIELLPQADRLPIIYSWYLGDRAAENVNPEQILTNRETGIEFRTDRSEARAARANRRRASAARRRNRFRYNELSAKGRRDARDAKTQPLGEPQ